ncbi:MAG: TIGR03936 family radical SAM-associated protein [Clostridiales bacterium]|jgi:radical SAM-linked protein|nr:TIGR03936 family radical SAM-associated protein [Clostridiales bacterium]
MSEQTISAQRRIRLCFSKGGAMRYISHLDLLRAFQRVMRRAKLPVAYSQGFNPHILLSFALPLPLGMESARDYADLALTGGEEISPEEIVSRLNENAPGGLRFLGARMLGSGEARAAAIVAAADYALRLPVSSEEDSRAISTVLDALLAEPTLVTLKKTKSGEKETDIRRDILRLSYETGPEPQIILRLSASSARFLNPETVAGLIFERLQRESVGRFLRLDLYREVGGKRVPLMEEIPAGAAAAPGETP